MIGKKYSPGDFVYIDELRVRAWLAVIDRVFEDGTFSCHPPGNHHKKRKRPEDVVMMAKPDSPIWLERDKYKEAFEKAGMCCVCRDKLKGNWEEWQGKAAHSWCIPKTSVYNKDSFLT